MSGWQTLLNEGNAGQYTDKLTMAGAVMNRRGTSLRVRLESAVLLEREEMQSIYDALNAPFEEEEGELHVEFSFPGEREAFGKNPAQYAQYLFRMLQSAFPAMSPFFAVSELRAAEEVLEGEEPVHFCMVLPSKFAMMLWQREKCGKWLSDFVQIAFGRQMRIECVLEEKEMEQKIIPSEPLPDFAPPAPAVKKSRGAGAKQSETKQQEAAPASKDILYGTWPKRVERMAISAINDQVRHAAVEGVVCRTETKEVFGGTKVVFLFDVTDYEYTISCKLLLEKKAAEKPVEEIKTGRWVLVSGDPYQDKYSGELMLDPRCVAAIPPHERTDDEPEKRVELHLHTQMSTLDSMLSVKDAVATAKKWGHKALAVTDHGVVQAYPYIYGEAEKAGIKVVYGMEGYLLNDCRPIDFDQTFVVVDIETTGIDHKLNQILEIAAVKLVDGKVVDVFESFVNPCVPVPPKITELTGITTEMVADAPMPQTVLREFAEFSRGCCFVAHNASFDLGFITDHGARAGIEFPQPYVDTLMLSRYLLRQLKHHKLDDLTEYYKVSLDNHHRALCDAEATAEIFLKLRQGYRDAGAEGLPGVFPEHRLEKPSKRQRYHIVMLVEDQEGLTNIYKLVTYAHLDHFDRRSRRPCIPRSLLLMHRKGLILGSACEAGELFRSVLAKDPVEVQERIASFYDYLEVQPIGNNAFLIREEKAADNEALRDFNRQIVDMAERLGKPCVATGDVHFKDPQDEVFRRIITKSQGYSDAEEQPPLYYKTTREMLDEFAYLGEEKAREIVITVPNAIAERCQMMKPFPFETCAPEIEGAEEELVTSSLTRAREIYGNPLPPIVQARLDRELGSITQYGFSVLYIIARKLVLKSNSDGYLVGSRGSVGSSLVAFMSGITEVNSLQAHYVCPNCKHSDFDIDQAKYAIGVDMPDKDCPVCGTRYKKDGYTIPFETFLGFEGDKVPDIDLNFSGEYQPVAHKFCEELFGEGYVFRAGTISGVKDKTAFGMVKKYFEEKGDVVNMAELNRLTEGCSGVKRTTGQHPGGIVVVPKARSVFEFTPLQHPADEPNSPIITTHFDFRSMHDTLVKLDILGHDDPTMIRMLEDLTGMDAKTIPQDDPATMSLFSSTEAIGVDPKLLRSEVATYGIPEFGTAFVRKMLVDTKPTTMDELVRISGLSHGTDVWLGNAAELVQAGTATLREVICTRDDIMNFLILCGMDKKLSFQTMESVRKGKGLKPNMEEAMLAANVPQWYIDSCKKIKYMFPRAHAAAYVMMAFRIAYCKVHQPEAFYAAYFTVRADAFDVVMASGTAQDVTKRIKNIEAMGKKATNKDKDQQTVLELVLEMLLRGIELLPVDIMRSDPIKFIIDGPKRLLPPLNALPGLGTKAAQQIADARKVGPFRSQEDVMARAHVGKAAMDIFREAGCLGGLPETDQVTLF